MSTISIIGSDLAGTIRSVMDDIDVLQHHLKQVDRADLSEQMPNVNLWLGFGASQQTQLSMMGLGLSRTTAIALSEFIVDDSLMDEGGPKETC